MHLKPNKACKNMWLRAQIATQHLKQDAQTQDADDMYIFSSLYVTRLEAISRQ